MWLPSTDYSLNVVEQVRQCWATNIKKKGWGYEIVVRIHLRAQDLHHQQPSAEAVAQVLGDQVARKRIVDTVTNEQIIDAYARGEEVSCLASAGVS